MIARQPWFERSFPTGLPAHLLPVVIERLRGTPARIADRLAETPGVSRVIYCGRADHPQAAIARKQMTGGGQMIAFEVEGGKDAAFRLQNALRIIKISNNLGDAKSIITHPPTTTHFRIGPEARAELGITDGMLRLSVGLESEEDLLADLDAAVAAARGA
jgi:O-succinylhomoserine sulfhydrylase